MKPLNWIKKNRQFLNLSEIEKEIGMPFRTLRHATNEGELKRELPEKWEEPLKDWVKNFRKL